MLLLKQLADKGAKLRLAERLRRSHVIDVLQEGLVLCFELAIHVSPTIDEQTLSYVFHSEDILVGDIELIETLRDDLLQVLVKQVRDGLKRLLKGEACSIVLNEVASDSHGLILTKFEANRLLKLLQLDEPTALMLRHHNVLRIDST